MKLRAPDVRKNFAIPTEPAAALLIMQGSPSLSAVEVDRIAGRADAAMTPREQFDRDGYLVARGMFSADEMSEFIVEVQKADSLIPGPDYLDSGAMRFYHNVFYKSPLIQRFICQQRLIDFMAPVVGPDFWVRWDQAVEKGPNSGVFAWHQDNGYSKLGAEYYQLWIALSEMTPHNGGLWVVPGSNHSRLPHTRAGNHLIAQGSEIYDAPDAPKAFVAAEKGDVVMFSSFTLHKTYENTTERPRWAYVGEFLPTSFYDPLAPKPYFVVAQNGRAHGKFMPSIPGSRDLAQRLRLLPLIARSYYHKLKALRLNA